MGVTRASHLRRPSREGRRRPSREGYLNFEILVIAGVAVNTECRLRDGHCDLRNRRLIEQSGKGDFHPERAPDPGHYLSGEEGMPAEVEEVVTRADPIHPQHLRPDPRK